MLVVHRILYIVHHNWLSHTRRHIFLHFGHVLLRVHILLLMRRLVSWFIHFVFILKFATTVIKRRTTSILVAILLVNELLCVPHMFRFDRIIRLSQFSVSVGKMTFVTQQAVLLLLIMAAHFCLIFQINFRLALIPHLIVLRIILRHVLHLMLFNLLLLSQHHLMARKLHLPVKLSSELWLHMHRRLLHHHIGQLGLSHRSLPVTIKLHLGHHTS